MRRAHFYHLYVGTSDSPSDWQPIVAEHIGALQGADFPGPSYIGLVGGLAHRVYARRWIMRNWPGADIFVQRDEGFEQVTLRALHSWAKGQPSDRAVFYTHSKGVLSKHPKNEAWRRELTADLFEQWELTEACVTGSFDVVGSNWLTPEEFGWEGVTSPFFAGNFWAAHAGYLASLPEVGTQTRFQAEAWIGLNNPRAASIRSGWPVLAHPDFGVFGTADDPL